MEAWSRCSSRSNWHVASMVQLQSASTSTKEQNMERGGFLPVSLLQTTKRKHYSTLLAHPWCKHPAISKPLTIGINGLLLNHTRSIPPFGIELQYDQASAVLPVTQQKIFYYWGYFWISHVSQWCNFHKVLVLLLYWSILLSIYSRSVYLGVILNVITKP
jgi:hypothetical protein